MRLEAEHIGFSYYSGKWVLRNIDLQLDSGEIVGLTGPSGCGKTTLGRILAGYEQPREGLVKLNGHTIKTHAHHPVQLIFQHPEKAVNSRWRMQRTLCEGWHPDSELLQAMGIEKSWGQRWPNELSGGELQRFCVARAMGPDTKFLIADEMTTMLDAITQAQIWQLIMELSRARNIGVLVVSHESSLLERLCSRIITLQPLSDRNA